MAVTRYLHKTGPEASHDQGHTQVLLPSEILMCASFGIISCGILAQLQGIYYTIHLSAPIVPLGR
jgi:hypothetical protein